MLHTRCFKFLSCLKYVIGENPKCLRFAPGKVGRNAVYKLILVLQYYYTEHIQVEGYLLLLISLGRL